MNRRTYFSIGLSSFTVLLAGCSVTSPSPVSEERELELLFPSVEVSDVGWTLTVDIKNESPRPGHPDFHNVEILVYSDDQKLICKKQVGDLSAQQTVEIECTEFPYYIVAMADESPCDSEIEIMMLEYVGRENDDDHRWQSRFRECGRSIPPNST